LTGQSLTARSSKLIRISESGARDKIGPVNALFNRPIDSFEIAYAGSLISIPIGRLKEH
jgi:hypothetical protein